MIDKIKSAYKTILSLLLVLLSLVYIPIYSQNVQAKSKKLVAFTFDDGPGQYTSDLIDQLDKRNAKVTFFVLGQNATYYPDVVKKAADSGHQIGSHSWDHPLLTKLSKKKIKEQIDNTNQQLKLADGKDTHWLRPPYGSFNDTVAALAGSPMVYWSVDSEDWKSRNADAVYNKIMDTVYDGAIVLMHDIYDTSVKGALRAMDALAKDGYEFVTVSELLRLRGVQAENGVMYYDAQDTGAKPLDSEKNDKPAKEEKIINSALVTAQSAIYSDDSGSDIIGTISSGITVGVYNTDNDEFYKIKSPWGIKGFVSSKSLKLADYNSADRKVDETITVPDNPLNRDAVVLKASAISIGRKKTASYAGTIAVGTHVTVLEDGENGRSLVKTLLGTLGYIDSDMLGDPEKSTTKTATVPIDLGSVKSGVLISDTSLRSEPSGSIIYVIPQGENVTINSVSGEWFKVTLSDGREGYIIGYAVSRGSKSCFITAKTTADVNLRQGKSTDSTIIGGIPQSTTIHIIDESDKQWYVVITQAGALGYVYSEYLEPTQKL